MWQIQTTDRFDKWFDALNDTDRENVIAGMLVLEQKGPLLSRPYADTVKGSTHPNMKELRVQSRGNPSGLSLPLTRNEPGFCSVPAKRQVKTSGSTMR